MAIEWGAWEYSGGNGMRVGIDVSWNGPVQNGWDTVKATVEIYTENQYTYSDSQSLNFGGAIGGSTSFNNSAGGAPVKRATKTYTYSYGNNEYGSSPASRTFSASLSGAFNGVTPSKSVSSNVPARPIAAPNDPTNVSVSRVNDGSQRVTWTNKDTAARPWSKVNVDKDVNDNNNWANAGSPGGGSTSYTDGNTSANQKIRYRVRAENGAGNSAFVETGVIYTSPDNPTNAYRYNGTGAQQVVTWSNKGGYSEYQTEVYRGVTPAGSSTTTWTLIATVGSGTSSYTDTAASAAQATKYRLLHKTTSGVQGTLYSGYSNETTQTPGVTTPPLAPTKLVPSGLTVDPSLTQRLSWQFNPAMAGDTQTGFTVQHRLSGSSVWTAVTVASANQYWDLPANTYGEEKIVEWQVRAKGADPSYSPYATPVSFQTAVVPIAADPVKLPVQMDLFTGKLEANTNAYERSNYVSRYQSNVTGGGVRAVSATYGISWSQRFITISLGRSQNTFPSGHHDILNPYGWTVTAKQIVVAGGISRATLTVSASTVQARPGETLTVSGVGAPYDGQRVVRSISSNQLSFDLPTGTAAQTNVASGGTVFCTIKGHGGAADTVPSSSQILLNSWDALYYELPFGWGSGSTLKKNGLVNVTSKVLTSNVATIGLAAGHWFSMGDRVHIEGVGSPYDGQDRVVTAVTPTSISFALTSANLTSTVVTSPTAYARPSGKDTFFGNFKKVQYTADFVVPDNWVLIALRNNDGANVEWAWGDSVDPGFDSDSPVFKQAVFTSTSDATNGAGNKPALRVGSVPNGIHLRMDGNEIIAMNDDNTQGTLNLNLGGTSKIPNADIGTHTTGANFAGAFYDFLNIPTVSSGANVNMNAGQGNRIRLVTSSRRFKENIRDADVDVDRALELRPRVFQRNDEVDDELSTDDNVVYREVGPDSPWYTGFIAEEALELGFAGWVTFDAAEQVSGFDYMSWVVTLQAVARSQRDKLASQGEELAELRERMTRLEQALSNREGD